MVCMIMKTRKYFKICYFYSYLKMQYVSNEKNARARTHTHTHTHTQSAHFLTLISLVDHCDLRLVI